MTFAQSGVLKSFLPLLFCSWGNVAPSERACRPLDEYAAPVPYAVYRARCRCGRVVDVQTPVDFDAQGLDFRCEMVRRGSRQPSLLT